ncbi:hypothetical protein [uncultured Tateyamaria sp.]|uniref:hypothetical protein n=1 Tax=uncultured Tateyamaria sp. TaxID=455651 RepID=UPI0026344693|nr:hypothetical protein [uncultured Tateyamaria sp.]
MIFYPAMNSEDARVRQASADLAAESQDPAAYQAVIFTSVSRTQIPALENASTLNPIGWIFVAQFILILVMGLKLWGVI